MPTSNEANAHTVYVSSDPFGRAIKRLVEYLQQQPPEAIFDSSQFPSPEIEYIDYANQQLRPLRLSSETERRTQHNELLIQLQGLKLVESPVPGKWRLNDIGRNAKVECTLPPGGHKFKVLAFIAAATRRL